MDERQDAHVGFDELEHADISRNPRQDAEPGDEHELLHVARGLVVVTRETAAIRQEVCFESARQ